MFSKTLIKKGRIVGSMEKKEHGEEKVMKLFIMSPFESIHLSEVAKRAGVSKERAHVYLNRLAERGFLSKAHKGNLTLFKAELENELLRKRFETYEVEKKLSFERMDVKIGNLCKDFAGDLNKEIKEKLAIVFLFGSGARQERGEESDVDLLVVVWSGKEKCEEITVDLGNRLSMRYGIEVVPLVVTMDEFREGLKAKKDFYNKLWRDRIVIYGESAFIEEVSEHGI